MTTPECSEATEPRVAMLVTKKENSSNESIFEGDKPKATNRNNPAIDRKGSCIRQSNAESLWFGSSKGDCQPRELKDSFIKPLITISVMMVHTLVVSSKPKVELDMHLHTCVVGDNCLVILDHIRSVYVYSYNPKDGHRSTKTVDVAVCSQDLQSGQKYILMINQAI